MKSHFRRPYSFALLLMLIALFSGAFVPGRLLWGQTGGNSGQIVGQILDPSSASVVGAEVTVRNENTNFSRSATTDETGRYAVSLLPLGPYEVTVNATGFEPAKQEALVSLGSTISANFNLSVGVNREAVQVKGEMLTADTTAAPSKSILTALQLKELPSNGGRIQNLTWDIPGGQIEPE
jgi:hypothetical protein